MVRGSGAGSRRSGFQPERPRRCRASTRQRVAINRVRSMGAHNRAFVSSWKKYAIFQHRVALACRQLHPLIAASTRAQLRMPR
jgi:hypothetical protein